MSRLRHARRLALGLAVLLEGCAGLFQGKEQATSPGAIPSTAGAFQISKGRPGIVIGAPHGGTDAGTALIGRDLARLTGFGLVVATGPVDGRRFDPARPVTMSPMRLDQETSEARAGFEAYRRHVEDAAQGILRLYVEVNGDARNEGAGRVGILTAGLSRQDCWRVKTLFELIRDSRLDEPGVPRLEVWVEPLNPSRDAPSAAAPRALYLELPPAARTTYRGIYTELLGDFLGQSAAFLAPRAP